MFVPHKDFTAHKPVTFLQLQEIMDKPVIKSELVTDAVIIKSFSLYVCDRSWFLRVLGENGEEGCTMFKQGVVPISANATKNIALHDWV